MGSLRAARSARVVAALICAAFILTAPVAGAGPRISADLDGRSIGAADVALYHCHDFDYPIIHCFASDDALTAAVATWQASRAADLGLAPNAIASLYVRAWEHEAYSGASLIISSSTTNLGLVGWNDRITSFTSFGLTGYFYEHINFNGGYYHFTASTSVSNVGGAWNDRFSSIRVP